MEGGTGAGDELGNDTRLGRDELGGSVAASNVPRNCCCC